MRHQWADEQGVKPEANSGSALAHQHLREPGPVRNHDHVRDPGGGAGTAASRQAAIASKSVRRIMPQCGRVEMGSSGHIVKHLVYAVFLPILEASRNSLFVFESTSEEPPAPHMWLLSRSAVTDNRQAAYIEIHGGQAYLALDD